MFVMFVNYIVTWKPWLCRNFLIFGFFDLNGGINPKISKSVNP